jgi:hypothetical protein
MVTTGQRVAPRLNLAAAYFLDALTGLAIPVVAEATETVDGTKVPAGR